MRHLIYFSRFTLLIFLLAEFSACMVFGPQKSKKELYSYVKIKRSPKNAPTVEEPKTTYAEMLGKGYARIGSISSDIEFRKAYEKRTRKILLKEARKNGADIAWIELDTLSWPKQTRVLKDVSSKYVSGFGKPYKETTYNYGVGYKRVWNTSGKATLFALDPELAAKQLKEGRISWTKRTVECPKKRDELLDKLEKIKKMLEQLDPASFPKKSDYISTLERDIYDLKRGKRTKHLMDIPDKDYPFRVDGNFFEEDLDNLGDATEKDGTFFKDANDPRRAKLNKMVLDAITYSKENWEVLCDLEILVLPEPILFD